MAQRKPETSSTGTNEKHYKKRKEPRQKRSQNTVQSIKQAAILLMSEKGVHNVGTHEIADKAGVSIGSLYQYFPNREAILSTIYEDISLEYASTLRASIPTLAELPTELIAKQTINMLLTVYERHQHVRFLLQVANEMPQMRFSDQPYSFRVLARGSTRAYLANRGDAAGREDLERKAFFIEQIVIGSITAYLRDKPPVISRANFVRDLVRIVTAYLDNWKAPTT